MFAANDLTTLADIRDKLNTSPGEEEIVEAADGVAYGVKGSGNNEILAIASSPQHMIRRDSRNVRPDVQTQLILTGTPEVRALQFWADDETPVLDVQVRTQAMNNIGLAVEARGQPTERSSIPLGFCELKTVVYTQRFFLLPGDYSLVVEADGRRTRMSLKVNEEHTRTLVGEAFEERQGEIRIGITPDPRSNAVRETIRRQRARVASRQAHGP
jgi:hypothetical protein